MTHFVFFIRNKMGQKVGQVWDRPFKNTLVPLSQAPSVWDSGTKASNPYPARITAVPYYREKWDNLQMGQKVGQVWDKELSQSSQITDYAIELLRLASQPVKSKKDENKVSLPIPPGFDLPDPAKIYRAAYDLWQPVRDKMPAWVKYMSLRKAHQNGDKSVAPAHKEAEQAYYAACQQCPEFQYYTQVRQKLFPAPKVIDWEAQDHKRLA